MLRDKILTVIFSILIIYGVICGFLYSLNLDLVSDHVVPGLVAMEIFEHGNFQYNFPIYDPYTFTDVYTVYLIPQYLSNYDPDVLRLTGFVIYLFVLLVFSYLVYRYAGLINSLIFAALLSNLNPSAYFYFISPEFHVGTLLAAGILLLLLDPENVKKTNSYLLMLFIIFTTLIAFSDALIVAFILIPYVIYYFVFFRPRSRNQNMPSDQGELNNNAHMAEKKMDIFVVSLFIIPILSILYKFVQPSFLSEIGPKYMPRNAQLFVSTPNVVLSNAQLYFRSLTLLINGDLNVIISPGHFNIFNIAVAILFLAIIFYSFARITHVSSYLRSMVFSSILLVFLAFTVTMFATESWSARFLIYTAVSLFILIAISFDKIDNKNINNLYVILIIILIITIAAANLNIIKKFDYQPNKDQYDLINFLRANNYTDGYSNLHDALLITYLSKNDITLLQITPTKTTYNHPTPKDIQFMESPWLSSDRWYPSDLYNVYLFNHTTITKNTDSLSPLLQYVITSNPPVNIIQCSNYTIYDADQ